MKHIVIKKADFDKPITCIGCGKTFNNVYDWNYHYQYECDFKRDNQND